MRIQGLGCWTVMNIILPSKGFQKFPNKEVAASATSCALHRLFM